MNTRQIILSAAEWIEHKPADFEYKECHRHMNTTEACLWYSEKRIPSECNSPCCAVGWMGVFYGEDLDQESEGLNERSKRILGVKYWDLCNNDLNSFEGRMASIDRFWHTSAQACANALRRYADLYHPQVKTPDWEAMANATDLLSV